MVWARNSKCLPIAAAVVCLCAAVSSAPAAPADELQQAVNYVFTGKVNPQPAPIITDAESCIVVMRDPKWNRFIRYYLSRFQIDDARFVRTYAGRDAKYHLDVEGDKTVVEYLNPDTKAVTVGYKSAQISLPGNIDRTRKALDLIAQRCKPDKDT